MFLMLIPPSAQAQTDTQRYKPLDIKAPQALQFFADPRFEAADKGTVEFILTLAPKQPKTEQTEVLAESALCIAQHWLGTHVD